MADFELDAQHCVDAASIVLESIQDEDRRHACAGCALAAIMLYRGARTLEHDIALLEEFFSWIDAHSADDVAH